MVMSLSGGDADPTPQLQELLHVLRAARDGELSVRCPEHWDGLMGRIAEAVNEVVASSQEVTQQLRRVGQAVGREGRTRQRVRFSRPRGAWTELELSVNTLIDDLLWPTTEMTRALAGVADGDLAQTVRLDVEGRPLQGDFLRSAMIVNGVIKQLRVFSSEVTRVAREVGTDGKLGGQAQVPDASGVWRDLTDSVNSMASNLTAQVRNIADVTIAVASGDLSKKITVDVRGEFLQLKEAINTMVEQLRSFASEVTRVAREVGTDGKLGGQAVVPGVGGTWKDLTDNVNSMASNLTGQVRNIAEVASAIAGGDLSKKIDVDVKGEMLRLKQTLNTMVDQLNDFASEVTRVAREVGTEGRLGGQANVPGAAGTWRALTDSVNSMASNLTTQVRSIGEVTTAVARGDLSRKIGIDVKGEILELKQTINTMVDQLNSFAGEVTRVAREVGTEGRLGGQADVPGVAGTWKDLTDNVNSMANNLTGQVRAIADVATAIAGGDLSKKITVDVRGELLLLKETLNTMVEQLRSFAGEVTRVAREVGTEGRLGGQANVPGAAGTWKDLTDNVNLLAGNLTTQVRNIAEVTTGIARGDLSRKITVDVKGEVLELKITINTMVDQLNAFAAEVTRVAREVGTDGQLGGQARVPGVAGTWKDLTDTVNVMAANLTEQVRGIAKVVTAVANGDLQQTFTVKAKGEVAALSDSINELTRTLAIFADQVTGVAREVGVEGRLGGQANVPGAAGTWKDLTGNVNVLAANLTTWVRAIGDVATAVTKGDLTRSIQVDARGEVNELKDNINTMIGNLRLTTDRNNEQDWLKSNLARITGLLQGQRDLPRVGQLLLSELAAIVGAHHGVIYQSSGSMLRLLATYADDDAAPHPTTLRYGDGLVGQCAIDKRRLLVTDLPPDTLRVRSGLFSAVPRNVVVLPVVFEGQIKAVIELASLNELTPLHLAFLDQLTSSLGINLSSVEATMQTEALLAQSQQLAGELQSQQAELQLTNDQLNQKAQQLAEQNAEVERKNQQIEQARRALEDKATELALTSKYKTEFLANMSHELRTPLNSILILGQQLSDNVEQNLTPKQVEFARTIHGAGTDLLTLITDILDLSKIESGTVTVEPTEVFFGTLLETVARPFRLDAERRGLAFEVFHDPALGRTMVTDSKRLQQVLKNLLSNAFKFTERGRIRLSATPATSGFSADHPILREASVVVAFEVSDTGIGIRQDKQRIIFEAFQQADAGTSRKYGGTGLGLAISRELAGLLGGEIHLISEPGKGSTFRLFLPGIYAGPAGEVRPAPALAAPARHPSVTDDVVVSVPDDRGALKPDEPVMLLVEDDVHFARLLTDLAHDVGFQVVSTPRGGDVLELAREFRPTAVSLDVFLPDMPGWTVLSHLKQDPALRHIPVQVLTLDDNRQHALSHGAFSFVTKPASADQLRAAFAKLHAFTKPRRRNLLVVEDDERERLGVRELLGEDDLEVFSVATGAQALQVMRDAPIDCVVLDLRLPDMTGMEVMRQMSEAPELAEIPVVVFTGRELSPELDHQLQELARRVVLKDVESPERLLDETALFLHRRLDNLTPEMRQLLERLRQSNASLQGRKILVVDDDVRNIFALGNLLERHGMNVITAQTGPEAIALLQATPDVAAVLMDIMMPGMDGYETTRRIRETPSLRRIPIVAVTAKAMKGDREKCLEAGASDYLAKPVDAEQLLAMLRLWLHR